VTSALETRDLSGLGVGRGASGFAYMQYGNPAGLGFKVTETLGFGTDHVRWRFSVAVTHWSRSVQLLYIKPG